MKISLSFVSRAAAASLKSLIVCTALTAIPSSASWDAFSRKTDSPLPIKFTVAGNGKIASASAFETSERLYVAGTSRTALFGGSAHVDVQLIGRDGKTVAAKMDTVRRAHPRTARGQSGGSSYVASFPLEEARRAALIRVTYHAGAHS